MERTKDGDDCTQPAATRRDRPPNSVVVFLPESAGRYTTSSHTGDSKEKPPWNAADRERARIEPRQKGEAGRFSRKPNPQSSPKPGADPAPGGLLRSGLSRAAGQLHWRTAAHNARRRSADATVATARVGDRLQRDGGPSVIEPDAPATCDHLSRIAPGNTPTHRAGSHPGLRMAGSKVPEPKAPRGGGKLPANGQRALVRYSDNCLHVHRKSPDSSAVLAAVISPNLIPVTETFVCSPEPINATPQ